MHQSCALESLEKAAERFFERGLYRRRWDDCWDRWRMQRGDGDFLQRHLGICAVAGDVGNTKEVLYLVNRPGNAASQSGSVEWIDRAVELVSQVAGSVTIRGDTDFSHTGQLDRWDDAGRKFVLGMDAHPTLVKLAEAVENKAWKPFERQAQYENFNE